MNLPILRKEYSTINSFIDSWKKYYESDENQDKIYFDNLKPINELNAENIQNLFQWKNETKNIWKYKQNSIDKIIKDLANIKIKFEHIGNSDQDLRNIYNYSCDNFFTSGYIWNLFFLHILKYESCPIADRYAYTAFKFIRYGEYVKLSGDKWKTWDFYIDYRNFFNNIATETNRIKKEEKKEIDEALWGFGKFLERYPKIIMEDQIKSCT